MGNDGYKPCILQLDVYGEQFIGATRMASLREIECKGQRLVYDIGE